MGRSKRSHLFQAICGVVAGVLLLSACAHAASSGTTGASTSPSAASTAITASSSAATNGRGCGKVGVLLPETATARWENTDKPLLTQDIQAVSGVKVDYFNAGGSAAMQKSQADSALAGGDCILVLAASDADQAAAIVMTAKQRAVPVIAYDRLTQSKDVGYYVSFDNLKVGELQGQYIVDHYKDYAKGGNKNLAMINGAQTDSNAQVFRQGALNKLQPLFDNQTLKKVYDQFTPNWDAGVARTEVDQILTAQQNDVPIMYVANDDMANSAVAALKAKQLNGKVLVTGQDATVAGIHDILAGDQAMTVYKAIGKEAQATADLVKALRDGSDTTSLTNGATVKASDGTAIPSILETPVAVDRTNIQSTVIADNFVALSDVCQGLPHHTGGACP